MKPLPTSLLDLLKQVRMKFAARARCSATSVGEAAPTEATASDEAGVLPADAQTLEKIWANANDMIEGQCMEDDVLTLVESLASSTGIELPAMYDGESTGDILTRTMDMLTNDYMVHRLERAPSKAAASPGGSEATTGCGDEANANDTAASKVASSSDASASESRGDPKDYGHVLSATTTQLASLDEQLSVRAQRVEAFARAMEQALAALPK